MSLVSQIPLKLGQFGVLVGLIAPCTCDVHRKTRLASTNVLSSLLDLHGREEIQHEGRVGMRASLRVLAQPAPKGSTAPCAGRQEDKQVANITEGRALTKRVTEASRGGSLDEVGSPRAQCWTYPACRYQGGSRMS